MDILIKRIQSISYIYSILKVPTRNIINISESKHIFYIHMFVIYFGSLFLLFRRELPSQGWNNHKERRGI